MSDNRILNTNHHQVDFWRILGFLSSIIGLSSYLLSSSFHSIFAEWNTWKIILYISVSLIIAYSILFAKTWKLPYQNLLFRSHVAFLVLFLTSVYSFFYDKCVKKNPDAFSLISSGSFAFMSLSLSFQKIQLGFEDDLLKIFLGSLAVQLMKINLCLSVVGAALCYFPIVLAPSYLHYRSDHTVSSSMTIKIDTCAYDLRKRLCSILGIENDRETPERFIYPSDFESKLKNAIASGFVKESYEVFIIWRKQVLHDKLLISTAAAFQKLVISIEEVHHRLPLKYLKDDIEEWAKACNVVLKTLFPNERHACHVVFSGLSPLDYLSFTEVCQGITTQLLNYAGAVSRTTQSPERLFRIVDVLETLEEILPNMESLFCNQHCKFLYDEAITVCKRLEEAIRGVFMELENLIRQDPAKELAVAGGGLHPTNRYVMNYPRAACERRKTLDKVFDDNQVSSSSSSSLSKQIVQIVELLETNLEINSKIYNNNDSALCSFFMMNNIRYIVHEAKNSNMADLLGDEWMQEKVLKVRHYLVSYQRSSWDKVLELLNIMDYYDSHNIVESHHARENLELFKLQFEEICENQSSWVIFDDQLRNVITSSLKKIMLLAYENFMITFLNDHVETGDFGVQVIEGLVNKLFLGKNEHTVKSKNIQPTWTVMSPGTKDFHEWRKYGEKTTPQFDTPKKIL